MKIEKEIKLKTKIEENADMRRGSLIMRQIISDNFLLVREKLAKGLLSSDITPEVRNKIIENLALTGVEFVLPRYQVMVVKINDFRLDIKKISALNVDGILQKIKNIIAETLSSKEVTLCFADEELRLVVLRNFKENGNLYESTCVKNIQRKVEQETGYFVTVSCGQEKFTINEAPESYYEADRAMSNSTGRAEEALLRYCPEEQKAGGFPEELYKEEKAFIQCLSAGDKERTKEQLKIYFDTAERTVFYFWQMKYACIRLIMAGIRALEDSGRFYFKYVEEMPEILKSVSRLNLCDSRECLRRTAGAVFAGAVCENAETDSPHFLVRMALQYMEKYYGSQIRAKNLAEMLGITPNYFTRIFKICTNENFVDYLNKLRVKKAMILLKQPELKIYQISEMVGYSDYKYFSYVFRKYTKCTPKDFRNLPQGKKMEL